MLDPVVGVEIIHLGDHVSYFNTWLSDNHVKLTSHTVDNRPLNIFESIFLEPLYDNMCPIPGETRCRCTSWTSSTILVMKK